jgi:hypothetical protein
MRRTGPATHTPKSLASLSWPSRPCRASGQPSCGKRLPPYTPRARRRRLQSKHRRRCLLESRDAHRQERRRHWALEPISIEGPEVQQLFGIGRGKPTRSELHPWEGRRGDAQVCERGQRGDRRRHAAGEAVLAEFSAPQRANSHARFGWKTARAAPQRTGRPAG